MEKNCFSWFETAKRYLILIQMPRKNFNVMSVANINFRARGNIYFKALFTLDLCGCLSMEKFVFEYEFLALILSFLVFGRTSNHWLYYAII